MEFKFDVRYDLELMRNFFRIVKKKNMFLTISSIVTLTWVLTGILFNVLLRFTGFEPEKVLGLIMVLSPISMIVVVVLFLNIDKIKLNSYSKKDKYLKEGYNIEYIFNEDGINVFIELKTHKYKIKYEEIISVFETKENIVLIDRMHNCIVYIILNKKDKDNETLNSFRSFIKDRVPERRLKAWKVIQ